MDQQNRPNLDDARSPFLQHGAEQPVEWMPWGAAAFERARREDRPVLLDIGGVWCHWCHVMDRESYDDEETAGLINGQFVPVKVDRDERPDVDARYQRAVQALSGQGGWPLTAFLTPEGEPFYGGTYFPPEDKHGRPSFGRVLNEISRVWQEERERAHEMARTVRERLSAYAQAEQEAGRVTRELVDDGTESFAQAYDFRHGGFGGAPKFPNAGGLQLVLDRALDGDVDWAMRVVTETLDAMARGGLHDQLGGGFHRYATDARWLVPHFEKMAYDNGLLLEAYARAHAAAPSPLYREVVDGVLRYYRELVPDLVEAGGFPASQDADVGPDDDGSYWTWAREEVREAVDGDDQTARAVVLRFGLEDPESAMPTDRSRHVLYRALEPAAVGEELGIDADEAESLLERAHERLRSARAARPRPFVDETIYVNWTALVICGYLAAARFLGRSDAEETALRALDRVWDEAYEPGRGVAHRLGDDGAGAYLEDQADVARALLDAFELTQRGRYLDRARELVDIMLERFRDPETGAFEDRPGDDPAPVEALEAAHRPIADSPTPAGNATAALVLLRLSALLHEPAYRERAVETLEAFAGSVENLATAMATYLRAADWATGPVTTVVVVGASGDAGADALLETALRTPRARTVVRRLEPAAVSEAALPPELAAMVTGEAPRAYVCAGQTCAAPVSAQDALADTLRTFRGG